MHTEKRSFMSLIDSYIDVLVGLIAVIVSYFAATLLAPAAFELNSMTAMLIIITMLSLSTFIFQNHGMYSSLCYVRQAHAVYGYLKANLISSALLLLFSLLLLEKGAREFFLWWILINYAISSLLLISKRNIQIHALAYLRKKQYDLHKIIIVGDNTAVAREYVKEVLRNPQYGYMILGYVGDSISSTVGCERLGPIRELADILDRYKPNDVIFAVDSYKKQRLIRLVNICDERCVKVYFLPVIYGYFKHSRQIEQVGTMPLINIHSTPLQNSANRFTKRLIDLVGSFLLIILTSPIMLAAAIGVKLSSPGPILFKQVRIGIMGKKFTMLKFRSMQQNNESKTAWTTEGDPRKTKFGSFLRATAIDELPQLFNVFVGDMSLVGPRPEIPIFVEHFKNVIPLYMIKHYVKPGMTGLAQIMGLRGDTSIEDRIHADISYIENWTLTMDISILLRTPFKAFNKHERYSPISDNGELDQLSEELRITEGEESYPAEEISLQQQTFDISALCPEPREDENEGQTDDGRHTDTEQA